MARVKKQKSVYERIAETEQEIALTEQRLAELNVLLQDLFKEKDDLEMREAWASIKEKGLSVDDIKKLLEEKTDTKEDKPKKK